ncbi:MAG: fimbrillin family protein [Bacteroidales bacterium]|nr:fimbrillin family protein [Bacteroidales bacterium]MBQ6690028.1 fimbrillin family protein [Bacteroidales bacterium]
MINRSTIQAALTLCTIMLVCSCREEIPVEEQIMQKEDICFCITETMPSSRAVNDTEKEDALIFDGSDTLYIRTSTEDYANICTKGYTTTTTNLTSFYTSAFLTTGEVYFSSIETNMESDGCAHTGRYWPGRNLNFFANSHKENDLKYEVSENGECYGTFSYTLPAPDLEKKNDAANQPDYVFAIAKDCTNDGNPVPLEFRHAFSAICFRIGSMDDENRMVNYVSLKNAPSSGKCSFGLNDEGTTEFIWNGQNGSETYIQNVERDVANGNIINDEGIIFMMVPHTLSDIEMEISFTLHHGTPYAHEYIISRKLADYTEEWLADKKYIYTISASDEVKVEVTDQVTATVKSDVAITSKGSSTSCIRAAIIGYWINKDGNIVAGWTDSDGSFDWGSEWSSNWVKHTDGFYYYLHELEYGEQTYPLFQTYTLSGISPVTDAELELSIAVQSVIHHKVGEAWPGCPLDK